MSVPVTPGFISTLYGINGVPPTISDAQLAALLQPYLGTLPPAPFTLNMTLNARDQVLVFLNFIDPGIGDIKNSQPSSSLISPASDFAQSLQYLLSVAQTPQVAQEGMPAPIPPNSGGLARNTASALGSVINSLQEAFATAGLAWPPPVVIPPDSNVSNAIVNWGQQAENQALVAAALTQLNQDIPVNTVFIQLPGSTTPTSVTIPLNQSLQEVLETQYVDRGSKIIFSGLQALYNQQDQANTALGLLTQLQNVYNGIKTLPPSETIKVLNDQSGLQSTLGSIVQDALANFYDNPDYEDPDFGINVGLASVQINWQIFENDVAGAWSEGTLQWTMSSEGVWSGPTFVNVNNPNSQNTALDIANAIGAYPGGNPIINASTETRSVESLLTTGYTGTPSEYINDLPSLLAAIFPELGVQVAGEALNFGTDGNFQLLLNQMYQAYLLQSAQRLINQANTTQTVIYPDPSTGELIVNPSLQATNPAAYAAAQAQLQIILTVQQYAAQYRTTAGGAGLNLPVPGKTGYPTTPSLIPGITQEQFGSSDPGSLENSFLVILQNLVGSNAVVSGYQPTVIEGYLSADSAGTTIDVTKWIKGNWPTGQSDIPALENVALDQTQTYLSNAFSAASSLNDSLQQQLKQSFFLFQQFVQSATSALASINKIIVKMAQNISGR